MFLAAREKLDEGSKLLVEGKTAGGIYLLGYSAEMYLKTACFYLDNASQTANARSLLYPLLNKFGAFNLNIGHESFHSLNFFLNYLIRRRIQLGIPFDTEFEQELLLRIGVLYELWWVEMRYRTDRALESEGKIVLDDAMWLRDNHKSLWR